MNTLEYYERYRALSKRAALLQGQMRFLYDTPDERTLSELRAIEQQKKEIEESLEHYIPYPLPPRRQYRAQEEREYLFYRCIKGLTMMQTAELMCVSRDTVYRIRRRIAAHDGRFSSAFDADD